MQIVIVINGTVGRQSFHGSGKLGHGFAPMACRRAPQQLMQPFIHRLEFDSAQFRQLGDDLLRAHGDEDDEFFPTGKFPPEFITGSHRSASCALRGVAAGRPTRMWE